MNPSNAFHTDFLFVDGFAYAANAFKVVVRIHPLIAIAFLDNDQSAFFIQPKQLHRNIQFLCSFADGIHSRMLSFPFHSYIYN